MFQFAQRVHLAFGQLAMVGYLTPTDGTSLYHFDLTAREQGEKLQGCGDPAVMLSATRQGNSMVICAPDIRRFDLAGLPAGNWDMILPIIQVPQQGALLPVQGIAEIAGLDYVKMIYVVGKSSDGRTLMGAEAANIIGDTLYCVQMKDHGPALARDNFEQQVMGHTHYISYPSQRAPSLMYVPRANSLELLFSP